MIYRLRDIVISLLFITTFSWLYFIIIVLLAVTQERVFFTQMRTGKGMRKFRMVKFSTMRDAKEGEDEDANQKERLTFFGRILRRLSFDEIPQLINVLAGDMSLVGPRPLITDYEGVYSEEDKQRFEVKPGITGWTQVNGRNSLSWKERFELDRWYVKHKSLWLDFKIILKTLSAAIFGRGVYSDALNTSPRYDGNN